jgi:predicted  nucleic acid-binding Zn-ribbon protein
MGQWKCSKCGMMSYGVMKPLTGSCTKGGGHRWTGIGNASITWRCGKCGMIHQSASRPMTSPCMRGGNHTWRKA